MKQSSSNRSIMKISIVLLVAANLVGIAAASQPPKKEDLAKSQVSPMNKTEPAEQTSGRSFEAQQVNSDQPPQTASSFPVAKSGRHSSGERSGRMLDLDHLAGDIGKSEKAARDQSLSGNRQSRILSEDLPLANPSEQKPAIEGRSKKSKGGKKMSIQGFIPIVSLDSVKDGKQLDSQLESGDDSNSDEENNAQENDNSNNQMIANHLREQMAASYGGQTSIGHASFGVSPSQSGGEQQQQWQQQQLDQQQQEVGRANRKLLGPSNLRSGLANSRRLVSNLLPAASSQLLTGLHQQQPQHHPNQHQFDLMMQNGQHKFQGPMNVPPVASYFEQQQPSGGDCICVPFFQCKNGYLTESQLSKAQLAQIQSQNIASQSATHQIPRSLSPNNQAAQSIDLYANQQQQPNMDQQQQQQQAINDLIYEQLRKNIETTNLEQQVQAAYQQQPSLSSLIDERSKSGSSPYANSTNELEERSLLNQLANRRSSAQQQKSCGIMRTCCRIPLSMLQQQQHPAYNRFQQQLQQPNLVNEASQMNHRFHGAANRMLTRPNSNLQTQYSLAQPIATRNQPALSGLMQQQQPFIQPIDYQLASSTFQQPNLAGTSDLQAQNFNQMQPTQVRPQQPQLPSGNFMAGRCGARQTLGISGRVQNAPASQLGVENSAEFGEFPAHAAILKRLSPGDNLFVCSGVLISNQWLATAAHCVKKQPRLEELKVRLGEWDVGRDDEFYPFVESNIREIIVHPEFQPTSLANDIALVRLETPVEQQQMPHVAPACLATPEEQFAGQRCWVAGWGKDAFGQQGTFQSVLKKVDLPVVGHHDCEQALRFQTKLGKFFRLHANNICAGGERGKDACEGDGGAGLYCQDPQTGLSKAVGLVSWGIGCGQRGVPGVYVNLASYYSWIEMMVAQSGEENVYLDGRQNGAAGDFKSLINERTMNGTSSSSQRQPEVDQPANSTLATKVGGGGGDPKSAGDGDGEKDF